nr:outer membrane beta-barrel protein [uncultured Draconibacterium sp.]
MKRYKFIFLSIILLLFFGAVTAQEKTKNKQELSVYGKGILNSLKYDFAEGADITRGAGGGLGIQYCLYMSKKWSISLGLGYEQYHSKVFLSGFTDHYQTSDMEGADFDFYSTVDSYEEKQSVAMLNLPILFRYETSMPWDNTSIYGAVGFQLGIPFSSKYNSIAKDLTTSGYFQEWDVMLDNPAFMGFGSWGTIEDNNQKLDFRSSYSLLFELGFKHELDGNSNIYIGYYADLGLNQLAKESTTLTSLIEYDADNPTEFKFNPLFYSAPQAQGEAYVAKPKIMGFGMKIQYAFQF